MVHFDARFNIYVCILFENRLFSCDISTCFSHISVPVISLFLVPDESHTSSAFSLDLLMRELQVNVFSKKNKNIHTLALAAEVSISVIVHPHTHIQPHKYIHTHTRTYVKQALYLVPNSIKYG